MITQECKQLLLVIPLPNHVNNLEVVLDKDEEYVICNKQVYLKNGMELKNIKKTQQWSIKNYYDGKTIRCQYKVNEEPSINQINGNMIVIKNIQ